MWRRLYLLLLLVRVYLALSPSYIHPDEHFQGVEVVAGDIFGWNTVRTWEFNSSNPIRSVFPLWAAYGLPMQLLHFIIGGSAPNPSMIYYTLRTLFMLVSFVFEDWAIQELVASPYQRRTALLLVASSYVTWTFQSHTFSNSIETIAVAWTLVLIQRIYKSKDSALLANALLGCVAVLGVFNRITFPGFVFIPMLRLIPHYVNHPLAFIVILSFSLFTAYLGIYMDTAFYRGSTTPFFTLDFSTKSRIITPLNNLIYNSKISNLALHGLHPRYTHFLINLPQLLGPAFVSLILSPRLTLPLVSSISGTAVLSIFQHQEARFLIPSVPLILSSTKVPTLPALRAVWISAWIVFNVALGALMGIYHQGGVVPMQNYIAENLGNATTVVWWKTYSPPTWLLGDMGEECSTVDLMGAKRSRVHRALEETKGSCGIQRELAETKVKEVYFVAPLALELKLEQPLDDDDEQEEEKTEEEEVVISKHEGKRERGYRLRKVWEYRNHLGLDDLDFDFGKDGIVGAVWKVIDGRGLGIWRVEDVADETCLDVVEDVRR